MLLKISEIQKKYRSLFLYKIAGKVSSIWADTFFGSPQGKKHGMDFL